MTGEPVEPTAVPPLRCEDEASEKQLAQDLPRFARVPL